MKKIGWKKWCLGLVFLGLLAGGAWWRGPAILAWYYVSKLAKSKNKDAWVNKVVGLDRHAVSPILDRMAQADVKVCDNLEAALQGLIQHWGGEGQNPLMLLIQFEKRWENLGLPGRRVVLRISRQNFHCLERNIPSAALVQAAASLLEKGLLESNLIEPSLDLAETLLEKSAQREVWITCEKAVRKGLGDAEGGNRLRAIQLLFRSRLKEKEDLLREVIPRLRDDSAQVRQAALLLLNNDNLVLVDDLMPLLHDADEEVRRLCELALCSRGLPDRHLVLARLISDHRPQGRLKVLEQLEQTPDLDPGLWLKRLCQDPSPAVRAAAIRAAAAQTQVDLTPCLRELAQTDPSPTIRQLATHYLQQCSTLSQREDEDFGQGSITPDGG